MKKSTLVKIGIIGTLTIILFIIGINYLNNKTIFKDETLLYAVYERVDGLTNSSEVFINGYPVGKVQDIYFNNDKSRNLIVEISIKEGFSIPKNSIGQIYSLDLMGTKGIQFIIDKETNSLYESGDTIKSSIEQNIQEQVNMQILPLKMKAEELISSFDSVLTIVQAVFNEDTRTNLKMSFSSIKNTLTNLEKTTFTLDTLLVSEKSKLAEIFSNVESITSNFEQNNELLSNVIQNFSDISDSLTKVDVNKTISETNLALNQLNQVIYKINEGNGSLALLLNNDTLYNNIESATYHLNKLMRDLHENPNKYLNFSIINLGTTKYYSETGNEKIKEKEKKIKTE